MNGTFAGGPRRRERRVEGYPVDTDVTAVVTNGTQRWQIVFRHTSANEYVVSSTARL